MESVIDDVTLVFDGMKAKHLPVVVFEVESVNDEPQYDE